MKNKRHMKWILGIVAIVMAGSAFLSILYGIGFRITYAPELENDWGAVSAVASWAGVIASCIYIWYAIQVPKKIADRQNKIDQFSPIAIL